MRNNSPLLDDLIQDEKLELLVRAGVEVGPEYTRQLKSWMDYMEMEARIEDSGYVQE